MEKCNYCKKMFNNCSMHIKRNKECKKRSQIECEVCNRKTKCINYFYNNRICRSCEKDNDKYKTITKTTAKKEYFLNDDDLEKIDCLEVNNPHYSCASSMKLYCVNQVIKLADEKYKSSFDQVKREKEEKRKIRQRNKKIKLKEKENNENKRRQELQQALFKYDLKIREDSRLCQGYIDGSINWELTNVVKMCCEMHWLYNYTDYRSQIDKEIKENKNIFEYFNFEEIESDVRSDVINKLGYPDTWPWMFDGGDD